MQPKNGGLEDDVPFQFGWFLGCLAVNFYGSWVHDFRVRTWEAKNEDLMAPDLSDGFPYFLREALSGYSRVVPGIFRSKNGEGESGGNTPNDFF